MMWLGRPNLCAAVSNAGGMGNLTGANYESEADFRDAIRETRRLTDKPFMIGITLLPSIRLTPEHYAMYSRVCAEEEVARIEIFATPLDNAVGKKSVEMFKKAGLKPFHKVGSVRHARHAQKVGYDGVYAAGFEEGGAQRIDPPHRRGARARCLDQRGRGWRSDVCGPVHWPDQRYPHLRRTFGTNDGRSQRAGTQAEQSNVGGPLEFFVPIGYDSRQDGFAG